MDRERRNLDAGSARSPANADHVPRLLAFYRDVVDEDLGAAVGWQTVAWGMALADGSAVSVPVNGPLAVTVWPSLDEAAAALDAYVDTPDPRPRLSDLPPQSSHGLAAWAADPEQPSGGNEDRDVPVGIGEPIAGPLGETQGPAS